jgi:DNA ligase-1
MVCGDIGEVAEKLKTQGIESLEKAGFSVFRPVKLMLAQTAQSVREALTEEGGAAAFEYKYDGARVQIHKQSGVVCIFSRRLTDVTESLPDIVEAVKQNIQADSAIIEGEVIALDSAGYPIAFQHLMRRFKRTREVVGMREKIPLTLYLFDILFLNGESLIAHTYLRRRQILAETAGKIALTNQIVTDQPESAEAFLGYAVAAGHEGLMAKKLDSPYTPGRRGKRWLKIKTVLEPLDLVITAAEYGYGRRKGWLSDYYLGARDPESGEFLDVGKTLQATPSKFCPKSSSKSHTTKSSKAPNTPAKWRCVSLESPAYATTKPQKKQAQLGKSKKSMSNNSRTKAKRQSLNKEKERLGVKRVFRLFCRRLTAASALCVRQLARHVLPL